MRRRHYFILFGFLVLLYFHLGNLGMISMDYQPVQVHLVSRHLHSFKKVTESEGNIDNDELLNEYNHVNNGEFVENFNRTRKGDIYSGKSMSNQEDKYEYLQEGYNVGIYNHHIVDEYFEETDNSEEIQDFPVNSRVNGDSSLFIKGKELKPGNTELKNHGHPSHSLQHIEGFHIIDNVCIVPPSDPHKTVEGYKAEKSGCSRPGKDLVAFNQKRNTTVSFSSTLPTVTFSTSGIPHNYTVINDLVYMVRARFVFIIIHQHRLRQELLFRDRTQTLEQLPLYN